MMRFKSKIKNAKNVFSVILTFLLIFPCDVLSYAQIGFVQSLNTTPTQLNDIDRFAKLDVDTFSIPIHLGEVKYSFKGKSNKIVIHIQDAHCNSFAQYKISGIIDYLSNEYGISMVNLEGGIGEYNLKSFTSIAGDEIRREVAEHFVEKGQINGAEFYAITNPGNVTLWGIEDKDLYMKNLSVYRDSLKYKEKVGAYLKGLSHILNNLKRFIYSSELLEIDLEYCSYKEGTKEFLPS